MSTKTLRKRIALVAVASLGFGLLSVAPSQAATGAVVFDPSQTAVTVTAGVASSVPIVITTVNGDAANNDAIRVTASVGAGVPVTIGTGTTTGSTLDVTATGAAQGWALSVGAGWVQALAGSTAGTGTAKTATDGKILGNVVFTPTAVGLFTITLTGSGAGSTFAATKTITVNAVAGANNAALSYITRATTVVDSGVSPTARTLTVIAAAAAGTYPGYSSTVSVGLGDGTDSAVTAITVPISKAIIFDLKAKTNNDAWSTGTRARLFLNGALYADKAVTVGTGALESITSPSSTGTYTASLVISGSQGSFDPSFTESIPFTLTVGSTTTAAAEFGNAADTTASSNGSTTAGLIVPSVGVTVSQSSGRVGQMVAFAPNYNVKRNAGADAANSVALTSRKATLRYSVTNPAGTAVSVVDARTAGVATTSQAIAGSGSLVMPTPTAAVTTATPIVGTDVFFATATAGTYTVTVFHDADGNGLLSAGEASGTSSIVIAADALPSITFTKFGSNTTNELKGAGLYGQLVKVSLRNGTTPWVLNTNESLVLTAASDTTDFLRYTSFVQNVNTWVEDLAGTASTLTLTAANFNGNGDAWINVGDTTDKGGTFSVSAVINGGTGNGASGSFTITTINTDQATAADLTDYTSTNFGALKNVNAGAGVEGATVAANTAGPATWNVKPGVATTVTASTVTGTSVYTVYNAIVTDSLGLLTGVIGAKYHITATTPIVNTGLTAASTTSLSLAIPATTAALPTGTVVANLLFDETTDTGLNIAVSTAVVDSIGVDPTDLTTTTYAVRAAVGAAQTFVAYVYDQFGNAMPGQTVTAQITSGRNQQLLATTLISDSDGKVSYKITDSYTGTLLNTDVLKFTSNAKEATVTVNYAAYNAAATVAITGGASADTGTTVTYSLISTAVAGASTSTARVKMTATVKDANGATLPAGIPVKWAISGLTGTSAILVDALTGYDWSTSMTDSNGEAITYVYAWANGTVSVTATAGTVTSATAGKINFINAAADARVVSATASATGVITAKVVDRYGNAVKGVSITATRTAGTGYFGGNAASSTSGETNASGTVDFIVVGGEATVTIATTTLNAGQTSSAAGYVGATIVTATGIGASLAPAGVQSVSVTVAGNTATQDAATAAQDAAAEATDAANAATDAANAAAEAADAATAAAQDAADAVAALSTQVTELVSALRKQITSLTNLVIKIQKKVRA